MTTTAPPLEHLIGDYTAAWDSRDPDVIASFHAPDGIFHLHSAAEPVRGRDAIRDAFAGFLAQFPDLTFVEQQLLTAEWGWVARWTMSGTLAAPLEAAGRTAEAGGRFEIDAVDVITVEDGFLTAKHTYLDWQTGLAQLGLA